MRAAVGRVVELVRPDGIGEGFRVAARLVVVVGRVVEGDGGDGVDLCTQKPEEVDLALGLRVRHVDDQLVAAAAADVGEADACVAGRAFDDGAAGLEEAALFGVFDDVEGCAVLDGAAGVHEFGFAEDFAAGLGGEVVEADEGRVADRWEGLAGSGGGGGGSVSRHTSSQALGDSLRLGHGEQVLGGLGGGGGRQARARREGARGAGAVTEHGGREEGGSVGC